VGKRKTEHEKSRRNGLCLVKKTGPPETKCNMGKGSKEPGLEKMERGKGAGRKTFAARYFMMGEKVFAQSMA
jgi:hypothetical protein